MKDLKQKLWLAGMVSGDRKILEKSISKVLPYFDGCIFVCDSRAKKEDIEWLESIKGEGKIIVKEWVNDHAHTSNEIILSRVMKFPDFAVIIDQTDEIRESFAKELRESIKHWHQNNVGCVWIDHPFIFRYHSGIRFVSNPHWGLSNIIGNQLSLEKIDGYRKENYVINHRDTLKSGFIGPGKYFLCYPPFSNHTQLLYLQFSPEIHRFHESRRINFQIYCENELGLNMFTLDDFIKYLKENVGKYPGFVETMIEEEVSVKDIFRIFVLDQGILQLNSNRHNFSYFKWKETGEVDQPRDGGFVGVFNKYLIMKGEPTQ